MPPAVGAGSGVCAAGPAPCVRLLYACVQSAGVEGRVLLRGLGGLVSPSLHPQTAFGDERSTSQGSQPPPPGSPLSREEGEAPPLAPAEEGRRRSRRVRLRGSCRHRPSLLGRRELASSGPAVPATASSEVSRPGTMGERLVGQGAALWSGPFQGLGSPSCRAPVDRHRWASEGSVS